MRKTVLPVTSDMAQRSDIVTLNGAKETLVAAAAEVNRLIAKDREAAVKEGYAQALADVSALCEARARRHETSAKHGFAHEARELSKDVTKRLPLAGALFAIDGAAADAKLIATGYAQALKNVHEYRWPHRGGPTEDEFSDFYAAIEARARPARCEDTSTDPCDNPIRCRRPAGHRADDGGPGWHACGDIFWDDDSVMQWGDEGPHGGPFTPQTAYEDQLPERVRMADDRAEAVAEGYAAATEDAESAGLLAGEDAPHEGRSPATGRRARPPTEGCEGI